MKVTEVNKRRYGPCSACGDGDTAQKYHSHDLRLVQPKSYTLASIEALAFDYCNDATSAARLDDRLRLSLFIQWLQKREREVEG